MNENEKSVRELGKNVNNVHGIEHRTSMSIYALIKDLNLNLKLIIHEKRERRNEIKIEALQSIHYILRVVHKLAFQFCFITLIR